MTQAGTQQDADKAVEEQWVEQFVLDVLFLIKTLDDDVGQCQTYQPAQSIPAERTKTLVRIPDNIA